MKRIISIVLAIAMSFSLCSCGKTTKVSTEDKTTQEFITRGQWVEAVSQAFGLDQYKETTPYFIDVAAGSELFDDVQSCYEWQVISTDTKEFKPNDVATLGFVVSSAVMAIDGKQDNITNEQLIDKALEYGLIEGGENLDKPLKSGVTPERADVILATAKAIILTDNMEIVNDIEIVNGVNDLSDKKEEIKFVEENKYVVDAGIASELKKDDVIIVPGTDPMMAEVAIKVIEVKDNGDGTYEVISEQPEIEEVLENIKISGTRDVDYRTIVPAEGVTVVPLESGTSQMAYEESCEPEYASLLCTDNAQFKQVSDDNNSFEFKIEIENKDGKYTVSESTEVNGNGVKFGIRSDGQVSLDLSKEVEGMGKAELNLTTPDFEDENVVKFLDTLDTGNYNAPETSLIELIKNYNAGLLNKEGLTNELSKFVGVKEELDPKKPFDESYKISGSLKVEDFKVTPNIEFNKTFWGGNNYLSPKEASIHLTGTITNEVKVEGKIEKELKLADIPVASVGIASINIQLFAYFELSGEISFKTIVNLDNKVIATRDGIKKVDETNVRNELNIKATLEAGLAAGAAIYVCGFEILSVRVKFGSLIEGEAAIYSDSPTIRDEEGYKIVESTYNLRSSLTLYAPIIKLEVNKTEDNILKKFGISGSFEICNKDNATKIPIIKEQTCELYKSQFRIPIRGAVTVEGEGDILSLNEFVKELKVGEHFEIGAEFIPEGYTSKDLVWSVEDSTAISFNDFIVKGLKEDTSTYVICRTKDGKYEAKCRVLVD